MFKKFIIGFACALALGLWASAEAQTDKVKVEPIKLFEGQWINDRNSAVRLIETDGVLSGYYQTALGQPDKSKRFPLTGFVEGDQITFTVNFKGYGSMTSWTGQLTEDEKEPYIRTLWNLTRDIKDENETDDMWNSITSGASDFRPLKAEN